ncbi:MAG: PorT family protein [Bacteroidaceae bacterium]|nr:PorT family protein [Bacteroidaceae bacterium]
MDEKKTIKTIQDKLSQHRVAVPDNLWERISENMPSPIVWYKHRTFYGAAAAIACIVIATCCLYTTNNTSIQESEQLICTNRTQPQDSACNRVTCLATENNIEENKIETTTQSLHTNVPKKHTPSKTETNTQLNTFIANSNNNTPNNNIKDKTATDNVKNNYNAQTPPITSGDDNELYYDDMALKAIEEKCNKRKGNSVLLSFDATTSVERKVVTPMSFRCYEGDLTFIHKMPFTMRALVEKRFGRWGVGVGASYTYMVSDYELSNKMRMGKQELHYIGIPLYASFEFARVGKFAFYTAIGGQLDINTAGSHKELPESCAYKYFDEWDFRDKKLQFSAQLRLGAAFEITKHLDVFVEPILGYYFANDSKIHSLWHDAPLSASIALGIRTWF